MINWFNVADYEKRLRASNFFIGGRGIGKTFSAFSFIYNTGCFMYVRNTLTQLEECCCEFGNPFKKWNKVMCHDIHMIKEKNHALILEGEKEDEHIVGYGGALSATKALRGIDLSDVKIGVLDEFIEDRRLSFDQGKAYDDLYETVNRNRELEGEEIFKCLLLSNAQKLNNPILARKNLITPIEDMLRMEQQIWANKSNFVCIPKSEVSDLKAKTSFYDGYENSKTYQEAIENKFANDSFYGIKKRPLKEYVGLCMIDGIYIYKHKNGGKLYACMTMCNSVPEFTSKDNFALFYRAYGQTLDYMSATGDLEFSDFTTKTKLFEILKI